jgi:DNA processing protein
MLLPSPELPQGNMDMSDELQIWIALYKEFQWTFTPRELKYIKQEFNTLTNFWSASEDELFGFMEKFKLKPEKIHYFIKRRMKLDFNEVINMLDEIRSKNIKIITCLDREYPFLLKSSNWPVKFSNEIYVYNPRIIFVKGDNIDFSRCVSIVGTRNCSNKGAELAYDIGRELSKEGVTVVSGMAVGIDSGALRGVIDSDRRAIGVLAWLEPIYPEENIDLAEEIQRHGCLLSEFYKRDLIKSKVDWFLERNKIIAGLSSKIIIVETGVRGGSIRVAKIASNLKREIYVCEPPTNEEDKWNGFKRLIKHYGAKIYKNKEEILYNLR